MQNGGQISSGFFLKNFFVLGGGRRRNFGDVVWILSRKGDTLDLVIFQITQGKWF